MKVESCMLTAHLDREEPSMVLLRATQRRIHAHTVIARSLGAHPMRDEAICYCAHTVIARSLEAHPMRGEAICYCAHTVIARSLEAHPMRDEAICCGGGCVEGIASSRCRASRNDEWRRGLLRAAAAPLAMTSGGGDCFVRPSNVRTDSQ